MTTQPVPTAAPSGSATGTGPAPQQVDTLAVVIAGAATATGVAAALAALSGLSPLTAGELVASVPAAASAAVLGPASRQVAASEPVYRAAYLLAAAGRVKAAIAAGASPRDAVAAERRHAAAHLAAASNRRAAALTVDKAAARHGAVLGWRAVNDSRTSAECARADGRNFEVGRRPFIGWPGSVHVNCRCRPVAPFAGAGFVDDVVTQTERKAAAVA